MLQLDDVQLYDLSEAGALLFSDPARLARQARLRQVPSARVAQTIGLPAPWVEAQAGRSGADPISLQTYWLERLAPPAADARRPERARTRLPATALLTPEEAARRLCATAPALARLQADGSLPGLRVDGTVCYDEVLVDLVVRADDEPALRAELEARRAEVRDWARFEYRTEIPAETPAPSAGALPTPKAFAFPTPEPSDTQQTSAPGAYEIPTDLGMDDFAPLDLEEKTPGGSRADDAPPPSSLIDVEGFETLDED